MSGSRRLAGALVVLFGLLAAASAGEMSMAEAQRLLKEEGKDGNALFSVSFYFEQAGRPFSALRAVERAIEVDPKVPGFHARYGQLLAARKRFKEAAGAYGRAADMDPATKAFRAAEARALSSCWMLPAAAGSWKKLLEGTTDRQEVLDAARNLAGINYQNNTPAGAEAAWITALGKLTEWSDRLAAADEAARAMLAQKAPGRAMDFWEGLFAKETDWTRRADLATRMMNAAMDPAAVWAVGPAGEKPIYPRAEAAWRKVLAEAAKPADRQRAALAVARIELRAGAPEKAVEALKPLLYASDWNANYGAAGVLAQAYAAQLAAAEREALWREFLGKGGDFNQRSQAAEQLVACLEDQEAVIKVRREMVAAFPNEVAAGERLAEALAAAGRFEAAVDAYEALLPLVKRQQHYSVGQEYGYWQRMVDLCAQADRPARALELMKNRFAAVDNSWQVASWLGALQRRCGEYAALNAADKVAEMGTVRRLGAGQFLMNQSGRREAARTLLETCAADGALKREYRRQALQWLMSMARGGAERLEIARRMAALGADNRWERGQALATLAQCLAAQGEIEEGARMVRDADKIREDHWCPGPDVLNHLGSAVFQGSRVGPGLRTPAGQKQAEEAAEGLYRDFAAREEYRHGLQRLSASLAELHARRGDYNGAVEFLHRLCGVRESGALRLELAGLLERKGDEAAALAEHLLYSDAAAAEHAEGLRKAENVRNKYHPWPNLDGRFPAFLEAKGKDDEYLKRAGERLEKTTGLDREGVADLLLVFYRQRNRPEDMGALLKRLKDWGHGSPFYTQQEQWVTAAIRMKNASSQADAQRREQLLNQVRQWEKTFAANPEDYQAALNAYKTYQLLGRKESDGQKFLDKAKELAQSQRDPLVLELYGRELMLDKMYANAAKAFELAAEVTGRRMDYEESIISSYELAGKHKEAVNLALDSLEEGRHQGRGFRSVEQIMDMAERSDNLKHLYAEVKRRVLAAAAAKAPIREGLAQLGLRLAWDNADDRLSALSIDALVEQARDPQNPWQDEWRLAQLIGRAVERRRLADAARVRQAILAAHEAQGYAPDLEEHRALALLLIETGKAKEAAEVMFAGLARAGQGVAQRPQPRPRPWRGRREMLNAPAVLDGGGGGALIRRDQALPWTSAIMGMAAREAESGGKDFKEACGARLADMVEAEVKLLEKKPCAYAGPALGVERPLGLSERITAAYRAAAGAPGAASDDHLALARRLAGLAGIVPKEKRPAGLKLEEIVAACKAAAEEADAAVKATVLMDCARLYRQLLAVEEKERLAGVKPELALAAYEAAAGARAERWGLDALREALAVAGGHKVADKALEYARKLHEAFPSDLEMRHTLAGALLGSKQVKEALALLNGGLGKGSTYQDYLRAADLCMNAFFPGRGGAPATKAAAEAAPEDPATTRAAQEAAGGAADFCKSAIAAYLEEVGRQVDAKGQPLPDGELGAMQAKLSAASAAEGRPEAALAALLDSVFNAGETALGPETAALLADAYAKAGKTKKLIAEMEAKVKADPQNLNLRLAQATVLEKSGDFAGAAVALQAAKVSKPELAIVKRLVEMLRKAGQFREALAECQEWASAFPRDADAYRAMAEVYKELKDPEGEVSALTMLVEVAPREAANCRQVAVLFAGRKDWSRALGLMERAMELRPEEPYRHIDVGEVLYLAAASAEADKDEARKQLLRAEKICSEALARDWEKGLSPELLARMPPWKGTFETRAHSLLADIYDALKQPKDAARERLSVPAGYKRPELEAAVPTPGFRNWWGPMPPVAQFGRGRLIEE